MLTIGIEEFPFKHHSNQGPKVFLRRLAASIEHQRLAALTKPKYGHCDIALFKNTVKNEFRPFALRVDGIYFDRQDTLGDSDALNAPIFSSIEQAAGIVFISDFSRKLVEAFHATLTIPYKVIHNSVDIQHFTPEGPNYRERLGFREDDFVFVTAARWRRWKRLKEIVTLFHLLRTRTTRNYKLLVLGENPDYVVADQDIVYAGEIPSEDLPPWYRSGDMYLHLATLETCGNTQVEAIACGLPVVCTNNGGIGETVRAANAGIVSQADPEFTYEKIAHYNPSAPDYKILLTDIQTLLSQYQEYKNNIHYEAVSIDAAARKYVAFMTEVFHGYLSRHYRLFPVLSHRVEKQIKKFRRLPAKTISRLVKRLTRW